MDHAAAAASDLSVIRFSADDWPHRERVEAVRELYARTIMRVEIVVVPDGPLELETRCLPGLGLADVTCSEISTRRTAQHLVSDDLCFNISLSGARTLTQRGREESIEPGEALLTSGADVSTTAIRASRFIAFGLPRKAIARLVPDLDNRVARPIRRDCEALQLLTGYAGLLRNAQTMATPAARHLAVTHVYDLIALALGATRDAAEIAKMRGARAARLRAVKTDIEANLDREDLSVATLAARHRLAVRYVQRLFEAEGTTFTEFVLARRLERAHRLLIDPRFTERPVSMIAFEVGFGHVPYFNQAFRRRFGDTPSDVRAQARRAN
jgi:AraC-like DNA-binding protein